MSNIWFNNNVFMKGYTQKFSEIYESNEAFVSELSKPPYSDMLNYYDKTLGGAEYLNLVYLLLYSRYGNWSIASSDVNRFKANLVERLCAYGPTHKKRIKLQEKLRELTEEEIQKGSIDIFKRAIW